MFTEAGVLTLYILVQNSLAIPIDNGVRGEFQHGHFLLLSTIDYNEVLHNFQLRKLIELNTSTYN